MFNIISKTKYAYLFSGTLIALSVLSLFVWGMKFDIDFTGGTRMEVEFAQKVPSVQELGETIKDLNLKSLILVPSEKSRMIIRYASEEDKINEGVFKKNARQS
jgi:preprotein translocase subunit SecF